MPASYTTSWDLTSPKFEPAAVTWLTRLAVEARDVRLVDVQLAAAAIPSLRGLRWERAEKSTSRTHTSAPVSRLDSKASFTSADRWAHSY